MTLLALGLGMLLGLPRLPEPAPADAPGFSATRAMTLVATATEPRPSGSPAHEAMLAEVGTRLEAAGLVVDRERVAVGGHRLQNLVASAPGAGTEGGVWLVAHSDSVPEAPGAADDGLGLAVVTEAAAVLSADWVPPELHVLVTDGEEIDLLGARAFVLDHPGPRLVINVEARGTEGPAYMFQTAGDVLGPWQEAGCAAQANSLAKAVYDLLPNDTDFTVFRGAGHWGYDFALIHGAWRYHSPEDAPAQLDPRSLQQVGDCVVALARAWLARGDAAPVSGEVAEAGPAPVYAQLFGWTGSLPGLGVRLAGLALLAGLGRPRGRWLLGAVAFVGAVLLAGALAFGVELLLLRWPPFLARPAEMVGPEPVWAFAAALGLGSVFAFGRGARHWGFVAAGVVLAAGLALAWPVVGWLWLLPGLAGLGRLRGWPTWPAAFAAGLFLGPFFHGVYPALTTRMLPALAVLPVLLLGWLPPAPPREG